MAIADVSRGWGALPGNLDLWTCPSCRQQSQVMEWKASSQLINQRNVDCRQCPKCQYNSWSVGDTIMMARTEEEEKEKKAKAEAEAEAAAALVSQNGQMQIVDAAVADSDHEDEVPADEVDDSGQEK